MSSGEDNAAGMRKEREDVDAEAASEFQHTGEHLLLALYDGGRLWFRDPFEDGNHLGDRAEELVARGKESRVEIPSTGRREVLVRDGAVDWEALIVVLDLPVRTMPGRDPEEVWIPVEDYDRVAALLAEARVVE